MTLTKRLNGAAGGGKFHCWVLKTTSGADGMEHWDEFVRGKAVLIGWERIEGDPSKMSNEELHCALRKEDPDEYDERREKKEGTAQRARKRAITKIRYFVGMDEGDKVLICRGYKARQITPVHVYGIACVTGPFKAAPPSRREWRFKHDAKIHSLNDDIPWEDFEKAIGLKTSRETIHHSECVKFDAVLALLQARGLDVPPCFFGGGGNH